MKMKRSNVLTYGVLISASIINTLSTVDAATINKIQIENPNYVLQKYEPKEGTYLGTYILQDKRIIGKGYPVGESKQNHSSYINKFENSVTSLKGMGDHASYFKYVGYKTGNLNNLYAWIEAVVENNAIPHIALEPNNATIDGKKVSGLDLVSEDEYLINLAKKLGSYNTPIFLRYASEMNGSWSTGYYGNPEKYKQKWKIVHDVMEKYAPNVVMVWNPNDEPAELSDQYYPGDAYVDWIGVNTYHAMYTSNDTKKPVKNLDQTTKLDYFYNKYAHKKPMFIGEYGTAHHTTADKNANNTPYAIKNLEGFYNKIKTEYPRIKAIYYFNVNTQEDGSIPEVDRRVRNYSLTDETYGSDFSKSYKKVTSDSHFIKEVDDSLENLGGKKDLELVNLPKGFKVINGNKYISVGDLANMLNGSVSVSNKKATLNALGKKTVFDARLIDGHNYIKVANFCSAYEYNLVQTNYGYKLVKKNVSNQTVQNTTGTTAQNQVVQTTTPSQLQVLGERMMAADVEMYKEVGKNQIAVLSKGTIVDLNEISNNWVKVTTKDGKTGYVDRSKVSNLRTSKMGDRRVKSTTGIYSSMVNGTIIKNVSGGSIVALYSAEGNWAEIQTVDGVRGYINRSYLATV